MFFRGKILALEKGAYASLILPLVQIKKACRSLYDYLLNIIWSELIYGKTIEDEQYNLFLFVTFIVLAVGAYRFESIFNWLFLLFLLIWFIDYWLAKLQYADESKQGSIILFQKGDKLILWQKKQEKISNKLELNSQEFKSIIITNREVYGGAFEGLLGKVWQVKIIIDYTTHCLVHETKQVWDAFEKGKYLADYFKIPLIFKDSEGKGEYAEEALKFNPEISPISSQAIECQHNSRQWHIYSKWQIGDSCNLLQQVLQKSGFWLFLAIVSDFIVRFGRLMDAILGLYFARSKGIIYLPSIWEWFQANLDEKDIIKFAIALGILIINGAQLSRRKHIYLDKDYLRFSLDNRKIARLGTSDIEATLLVKKPQPIIVIIAKDSAITINGFSREKEYRNFLIYLSEGIEQCQNH